MSKTLRDQHLARGADKAQDFLKINGFGLRRNSAESGGAVPAR
jgi:hypothetical protein